MGSHNSARMCMHDIIFKNIVQFNLSEHVLIDLSGPSSVCHTPFIPLIKCTKVILCPRWGKS